MSPVQLSQGRPPTCAEDGHDIVVRPFLDLDVVRLNMSCARCGLVMLPAPGMASTEASWLMKCVERARFAPEAPPEAYEGIYS